MLRRSLPLLIPFLLVSCVGFGPRSIQVQRASYTEVLGATDAEELLANVVRLRYLDTPVFLRISSVTASPTMELSSGVSTDLDSGTFRCIQRSGQRQEWRTDDNIDCVDPFDFGTELSQHLSRRIDRVVHLPVTGQY